MASTHTRNVGPMHAAAACGAKTRGGPPCKTKAISGKQRCRMHGGKGSGAPKGSQNARKHGGYSRASREEDRATRALIREIEAVLADKEEEIPE